MLKRLLIAITSVLLLSPFASAQAADAQLTGSVAYRERIALRADAVIDVQLVDTSVADVSAQTVAEILINAEGRQVPVPFTLSYDPAKIVPANRYSVRATIRSGDGMLMFSTTQAYPVLTHGASSKVNLVLHTVGHGAKPASSAKKQAAPSTSDAPAPVTAETAPPPTSTETPAVSESSPSATTPNTHEADKAAAQEEPAPPAMAASSTPAQPHPSSTTGSSSENEGPVPTTQAEGEPQRVPEATTAIPEATSPSSAPIPAPPETKPPVSSASADVAPPVGESSSRAPLTTPEQPAPSEPSTATAPAPEGESSSRKSNAADTPTPAPESTGPAAPAKAAEPETPLPDSPSAIHRADSEAPLPDSPSTSKRAELAAAAPDTDEGAAADEMPASPAPNKALTPLADTQWKLVQLNGLNVIITPPQKPVTIAFSPEGRRIAGSAGCNSYLGTFTDEHGRLQMHPGSMTMMACADPAGSREKKFVAMLRSADGYKISGDFLLLTSSGRTVAKFRNNQE